MTWLNIASLEAARMIHDRMMNPGFVTPTGLDRLDHDIYLWGDCRGIPQGCYVLVGGASNIGKTQFGLYMLTQAAKSGQRAGLISLDMKNPDAIARMQQAIAGKAINFKDWRPSKWKEGNLATLEVSLAAWRKTLMLDPEDDRTWGDIAIHLERGRSIDAVEARVREGAELGFTFFVIDHLQKIRVSKARGDVFMTADVVSEVLDDLVDELNVTILGLSQLNRQASREIDRRPTMFDLHGGTSMESNAAIVIMLDHSRYEMDTEKRHLGRTYLLLEKNQMGPKNFEVPVLWNHAELSIREGLDDELHEWPGKKRKKL